MTKPPNPAPRTRTRAKAKAVDLCGWLPVTPDEPRNGLRVCGLHIFTERVEVGDVDRDMTRACVSGTLAKAGRAVVVINRKTGRYVLATHYIPLPDANAATKAFVIEAARNAGRRQ